MSHTSTPSRRRSSVSTSSFSQGYDEERLEWDGKIGGAWSRWPRKMVRLVRVLRPRRPAVGLLLIDVTIVTLLVIICWPLITLLLRNEQLFGARLAFQHDDSIAYMDPIPEHAEYQSSGTHAEYHSDRRHNIPRILHQTSANYTLPERWEASRQSCKDVYSDYEYKHWTNELARDFIAEQYPWFVSTWDNYAFPIQRADAIRYFVLYHYGGIYLDMDTVCNESLPLHQLEADGAPHHAIFKSTKPTGVSNDLMVSSKRHPLFAAAIANLLFFNEITRFWARIQPHTAVMISAGPFFLTMTIKEYLQGLPSLPTATVSVINETELAPYVTDLEDCSWHHSDTQVFMWIGDRPWVWMVMGAIGLAAGMHVVNHLLLAAYRSLGARWGNGGDRDGDDDIKMSKLN